MYDYRKVDNEEIERLHIQAELLAAFDASLINGLFQTTPHPVILDVGCNDGVCTMARLRGRKPAAYLGIDYSEPLIMAAKKRYASANTHFAVVDVSQPDYVDKVQQELRSLGAEKADLVIVSLLLLHLEDPVPFLANLRSLMQPNGVLMIVDVADADNRVSCNDADAAALFAHAQGLIAKNERNGDRQAGRKVPDWLLKSGYYRIWQRCSGLSTAGLTKEQREAMYKTYFGLIDDEYLDDADKAWCAENLPRIHELMLDPAVTFTLGLRAYTAKLTSDI